MPLAFATVDWWIVGAYLVIATLPGLLCRKYIHGQGDFLLAGRTLSVWLATATLTATETGLVTIMYWSELGYNAGFSAMSLGVIALCCTLFVGLTGFIVSGLRKSQATTVAEFYEQRYSRGVRLLGGLIIAIAGILNYGIFLQVEATFIRIITGMPETLYISTAADYGNVWAIPTVNVVMSALLLIVLSYTFLGGMVSVVVTDYIQFIVMAVGMAAATYWVLTHDMVGGLAGMMKVVNAERPEYGVNPFISGSGAGKAMGIGVAWVVWQTMLWLAQNTWQTSAFRTAATESAGTTRKMWILTAFNYFGRAVIPMLWGVGALAFVTNTMDAASINKLVSREAMPTFLVHLPAGLIGFLTAGMLAALMSTHSSYLLAWGGVLTEDLLCPVVQMAGTTVPSAARLWITRFFILCIGGFMLYYGLWFKVPQTIWGYLGLTGTIYFSGSLTLMAFGLYWKRANRAGAYLGLLGGALPGLIYLFTNILVQRMELATVDPGHWAVWLSGRMTDQVTGLISFPLAFVGMILGSLLSRPANGQMAEFEVHPVEALT